MKGLRVAAFAAALLLVALFARAGEVPRPAAPTVADVTLVEYEVVLGEGTPASDVWATLQAISTAVHGAATNVDDANDERIGTYYPNGTWGWTIRDTGNRVVSEYTSSGTTGATGWAWQRDHIFRGSELVAAMTPGETLHYHLDHLGTPRLITSNGVEAAFHTYLPFGAELSTAPVESPKEVLKFTGHELDDMGGVYSTFYMHARSDSGTLGRLLSVDPIWDSVRLSLPQTLNRYSYVLNNPLRYTDPSGRNAIVIEVVGTVALEVKKPLWPLRSPALRYTTYYVIRIK